jgi:hypothetical protein
LLVLVLVLVLVLRRTANSKNSRSNHRHWWNSRTDDEILRREPERLETKNNDGHELIYDL